ncbi:MAG: BamA/TamA family outer membrane protein [Deltaproteobacteria bacterium]|nr:BamA/TamA family outer membrane protein [Deltaproteobacteria bacterium]
MGLVLALALFLVSPPSAPAQGNGGRPTVGELRVKGLKTIPEDRARDVLSLKPDSWKPWVADQPFSPSRLRSDADKLQRLLKAWGFFSGSVETEITRREDVDKVDITFVITEGPPTIVTGVHVTGLSELSDHLRRKVLKKMTLKEGDRFSAAAYNNAKEDMLLVLRNEGRPLSTLEGTVRVYPWKNEAEIFVHVHPGRLLFFGETKVKGLEKTSPKVLRSRLAYSPGQLYSLRKVMQSQRNLFGLGFFSTVIVEPAAGLDEVAGEKVPMTIKGQYREFKQFQLGLGYGTQEKFRVQLGWKHRHLGAMARSLELSAKYSELVQRGEAILTWPYFLRDNQSLQDRFIAQDEDFVSFKDRKVGNLVQVERTYRNIYHVRPAYIAERHRIVESDLLATRFGAEDEDFFVSALRVEVDRDSRDPALDPREGSLVSVGAEFASQATLSSVTYFQPTVRVQKFQPLFGTTWILAGRFLYTTIHPTENTRRVPLFLRLFSGGSYSVRGYSYHRLGPKDANNAPVGGESRSEASIELRFPLFGNLRGVLFSDAGMVLLDSFDFQPDEIRYTGGAGLRYATPVGPLRVDFGYKLNPVTDEKDLYEIHLSIGQAF